MTPDRPAAVPPPPATPPTEPEARRERWPAWVRLLAVLGAFAVVAVAALVPLVWLAVRAAGGASTLAGRTVWVAGGLPGPSTVEVGPATVSLGGFDVAWTDTGHPRPDAVEVVLPGGTHPVTLVLPDGRRLDRGEVTVPGGVFSRIVDPTTRVLNADGLLSLDKLRYTYADLPPQEIPAAEERWLPPALWHEIDGVTHPFELAPEEIRIPEGLDRDTRTELWPAGLRPAGVTRELEAEDAEAAEAYAIHALGLGLGAAGAGGPDLVEAAFEVLEVEDAQRLRPMLDERPVRVPVHKVWQDVLAWEQGHAAVVERYEALLATEGESADLLTLVARRSEDPARVRELVARALELEPQNAWANSEAAELAMLDGDLQLARDHASRRPEGEWDGRIVHAERLLGRWAAVRARFPEDPAGVPSLADGLALAEAESHVRGNAAGRSALEAVVGSFPHDSAEDAEETLAWLEAQRQARLGRPAAIESLVEAELAAAEPGARAAPAMRLALIRGDAAGAWAAFQADVAAEESEDGRAVLTLPDLYAAAAWMAGAGRQTGERGPVPADALTRLEERARSWSEGDPWAERLTEWAFAAPGIGDPLPMPVVSWRDAVVEAALLRAVTDPSARRALLPRLEAWNREQLETSPARTRLIDELRAAGGG